MIRPVLAAAMLAASPASAHDWYSAKRDPSTGYLCCSGADCAPIDPRKVSCGPDGCTLTLEPGDTATVVRAGRYWFQGQPQPSPDMGMHACYFPNGTEQRDTPEGFIGVLRCLWWGGGA